MRSLVNFPLSKHDAPLSANAHSDQGCNFEADIDEGHLDCDAVFLERQKRMTVLGATPWRRQTTSRLSAIQVAAVGSASSKFLTALFDPGIFLRPLFVCERPGGLSMLPTGVDFAPFGAVAARPAKCVLNARNNFARVSSLSAALTNHGPRER